MRVTRISHTQLYRAHLRHEAEQGYAFLTAAVCAIILGIIGMVALGIGIARLAISLPERTGIPSIDSGIYPDAHVESCEN